MNSKDEVSGHHRYILTQDLRHKVQLLTTLGLKVPDVSDPFFDQIDNHLKSLLQFAFQDTEIRAISMASLAEEIQALAISKRATLGNAEIVSTCPEITRLTNGSTIEVNRLIDFDGKIIGVGPRPGQPFLRHQIKRIQAANFGRCIVLVEDGIFTGSTIRHVIDRFNEFGIKVAAVVVGFAFNQGMENLKRHFDGEVLVVEQIDQNIDWVPDHDFFPFTPSCGRVLGISLNGSAMPLYTHDGATYSVPYLNGCCPMKEWASLSLAHAQKISFYCVTMAMKLYEKIEELSGQEVLVGSVLNTRPRISVPMQLKREKLPGLDIRVVDYLKPFAELANGQDIFG